MEIAAAAVGSVLPKLQAYLLLRRNDDHHHDIERLGHELASIHAALRDAQTPPGKIHDDEEEEDRTWARAARELAYDVEDAIDALSVTSPPPPLDGGGRIDEVPGTLFSFKKLLQMASDLSGSRPRTVGHVPVPPAAVGNPRPQQTLPDPDDEAALVGVAGARDALVRRLRLRGDHDGEQQFKSVAIVGPTGLGKTTVARAAYGMLKPEFDCAAFVSVGLDPPITDVLQSLLRQLGCTDDGAATGPGDENQLISQLSEFLQNKRYFVVLDDLWDIQSWEKIRCALVDNNHGSRIVTTTRNLEVADEVGTLYELKPLSQENSMKLLIRTTFGHEDKCCPDDELTQVADKILKKCGGVPLAIVTLAKLLASKMGEKRDWHEVGESIGSLLENTPDVMNMRMVTSLGYYNLPPHLRACLLYMSIFPEDYEIRRDRLIWRWIAEGFVHCAEKQGENLFELGESYFNELVNRSMIQLLDIDYADDGGRDEYCCSVSFPVMDLISHLSTQEHFVNVLNDQQRALSSSSGHQIRRVSYRGGSKTEDSASLGTISMPQLRSLSVFCPSIAQGFEFDMIKSEFLRVLDLEGCDLSDSHLENHLGRLIHLRYLGLRDTRTACVPEEIGSLKSLQILDIVGTKVDELPVSIVHLRALMCLRVDYTTRVPSGVRSLTALEELSDVSTRDAPDLVKELACLTKMRVLRITLWKPSQSQEEALVESLRGLHKIHTLDVYVTGHGGGDSSQRLDTLREAWAPPRRLREFQARAMNSYWSPLRVLPAWVDAASTPHLAVLVVQLQELRQRDVDALGRLPALRVLRVDPYSGNEPLVVAGGAFPRLTECRFRDSDLAPVFRPGAAPRLRRLEFCFRVRNTIDLGNGGFDFGLENLGSLEEAAIYVACQESWEPEAEAAEAALKRAADDHPNRASFDVITFGEELMCFDDDL